MNDIVKDEQDILLIKKYGKLILMLFIIFIAIYFAFSWYEKQEKQANIDMAMKISSIQNELGAEEKLKEVLEQSSSAYGSIAALRLADLYVKQDKIKEAITLFDNISADQKNDVIYRYLAQIRVIELMLNSGYERSDIEKRFKNAISKNNPYIYAAQELYMVYLIDNERKLEAISVAKELKEKSDLPFKMKERVNIISSLISR